jgi:branched-chain amino acid transport system permease protein
MIPKYLLSRKGLFIAGLLVFLLCLPFWTGSYALSLTELLVAQAIAVMGLNLLVGDTGLISLGHAGFMAVGAYGTAILSQFGIPPLLGMLMAAGLAAGLGGLFALPANRLQGPYLAIATLAFGLFITVFIGRNAFLGGHSGLSVPSLAANETLRYVIILLIGYLAWIWVSYLHQSRLGRVFRAIRDQELAAESVGVNPARYKNLSFVLSAALAGIAGSIWAWYLGYLHPGQFGFGLSVSLLAAVVLGGLGHVNGGIAGAILLTLMDQQFSPLGESSKSWLISGVVLIGVMMLEPKGLAGIWAKIMTIYRDRKGLLQ